MSPHPHKTTQCGTITLRLLALTLLAGAAWLPAARAHATNVHRCIDARGHIALQDAPCPIGTRASTVEVQPQPLIDPHARAETDPAEAYAARPPQRRERQHQPSRHTRRAADAIAWKCEADDGEVFYRLARCPGSIRGDGVVRVQWGRTQTQPRSRSRHKGIHVHATRVTRGEACRQINALTASARDGHRRDQRVSVYDHLVGRDPCNAT